VKGSLAAVAGVSVCLVLLTGLSGCRVGDDPSPSPTADAGESPSAEESASPDGVAIPTDCAEVMSASMYDSAFAEVPLNDEAFGEAGVLEPEPPPGEGVDPQQAVFSQVSLRCVWRDPDADITGLELTMARVDPEVGAAYLEVLGGAGYTCEQKYDGDWCQRVFTENAYNTEVGSTHFVRDDIYIGVEQTNFPTQGFLADVVETVWQE
jgi:hypothetical protein